MLVVNGHPRSDIEGLKDHQRNLLIIIKDGRCTSNTVAWIPLVS